MGACFDGRTYSGKYDIDQVSDLFRDDIEESQYESGHSYSGEIGMMSGIGMVYEEIFNSYDEAEEYIQDKHQKWSDAIAVKYRAEHDHSGTRWLVAGWCSS